MQPILQGGNLVKRSGRVTVLDHCDFERFPGEVLALIDPEAHTMSDAVA